MPNEILSITSYFFAFIWGIAILLSLIGWGGILNRFLLPKQPVDWGQKMAWGIAFSVFVGGVLNGTATVSKEVILIYLGIGFAYGLIDIYKARDLRITSLSQYINHCRKDRVLLIATIIVSLLILLRYAGSISNNTFNPHDDYHAYFVFPQQMLQTGSISSDPFGARRNYSLGGQSFLDTFVLSVLSEVNLKIIDSGVGLLGVIILILSFCIEKKTPAKAIISILFLFLLINIKNVNIAAVTTAIILVFSLFRFLNSKQLRNSPHFLVNACIIALIAAALCALKTNLIISTLILLSLSYFFHLIDTRFEKKALYEILSFIGLFIIFLGSWMLLMHSSAGTFLYPLLGKGYHGSVYGTPIAPYGKLTIATLYKITKTTFFEPDFLGIFLLSLLVIGQRRQKLISRGSILPLIISTLLGKILLSIATGGDISYRYSVPFVVPTLIILITLVLAKIKSQNPFRYQSAIIAFLIGSWLLVNLGSPQKYIIGNFKSSMAGLNGVNLFSAQEANQYTQMLEAIPPKAPILTRLSKPFLLDFKRNQIFLADYPGQFSPPPGMPFFEGSEALATYLKSQSIRYVAYAYAEEANFPFNLLKGRVNTKKDSWRKAQARLTFDFQDNLKQLGNTRQRIYDDGKNFVIDLDLLR